MKLGLLALLLAWGCSKAEANTILISDTTPWAIKTAARPTAAATDRPVLYTKEVGSCSEDTPGVSDCPWDGQNKDFPSNWSFVRCVSFYDAATNVNHYGFLFKHALPTAWPNAASWPAGDITCEVDGVGAWLGNSVVSTTTIVNHPDPTGTGEPMSALASLATPVPLVRDGSTITHHLEAMEWACRTLPSGTYIDGTTTCKKDNGASHPGLIVKVYEMGASDQACFEAGPQTITNNSSCPISRNGTISVVSVPVTVEAF